MLLTQISASPACRKSKFALEKAAQLLFLQDAIFFPPCSRIAASDLQADFPASEGIPVVSERLRRRLYVYVVLLLPVKASGLLSFTKEPRITAAESPRFAFCVLRHGPAKQCLLRGRVGQDLI